MMYLWCFFFSIQNKFGSFCKILDLGRCYSTHFVFGPLIILQFDLTEQKKSFIIVVAQNIKQSYELRDSIKSMYLKFEMMLYLVNQWHIHKYVN